MGAKKKAEEEAAAKKVEEEAAAKKKAEEGAAAKEKAGGHNESAANDVSGGTSTRNAVTENEGACVVGRLKCWVFGVILALSLLLFLAVVVGWLCCRSNNETEPKVKSNAKNPLDVDHYSVDSSSTPTVSSDSGEQADPYLAD